MFEQSQSVYTSLAHRCWNPAWDEAKNRQVYGDQASSQGLGANWCLRIAVRGESSQDFDLSGELHFLKTEIDHRCLWLDWPQFATKSSPLEAVSLVLAQKLFARSLPEGLSWAWLRVEENDHWACSVFADGGDVLLEARWSNLRLSFRGEVDAESGLLLVREPIMRAVRERLAKSEDEMKSDSSEGWVQGLFARLSQQLPQLTRLQVDLSRQHSLVLENP